MTTENKAPEPELPPPVRAWLSKRGDAVVLSGVSQSVAQTADFERVEYTRADLVSNAAAPPERAGKWVDEITQQLPGSKVTEVWAALDKRREWLRGVRDCEWCGQRSADLNSHPCFIAEETAVAFALESLRSAYAAAPAPSDAAVNEAAREIVSVFPELKEYDKWVTIGRTAVDANTETQTFQRSAAPELTALERIAAIISKRCGVTPSVPSPTDTLSVYIRSGGRVEALVRDCFCGAELEAGLCPNGHDPAKREEVVDEVQDRMDKVVEMAVEWYQSTMINLTQLFANSPTAELIEPRNHTGVYLSHLRLLLTDRETGHMQVLAIEAGAFIEPKVAPMLAISVEDVDEPEFSGEHGEYVDDGQSPVVNEVEPEFGYRVAIDGTETDMRLVEGGLF